MSSNSHPIRNAEEGLISGNGTRRHVKCAGVLGDVPEELVANDWWWAGQVLSTHSKDELQDFEGHIDELSVQTVIDEVKNRSLSITVLGSYPMALVYE